ncbi:MAG: hypothetical protein AAFV88_00930 [Planctomycetota bacterium]
MKRSLPTLVLLALIGLFAAPALAQPPEAIPTARPVVADAPKPASPPAAKANEVSIRPLSVTVELVDGKTKLTGTLMNQTSLDMKTSFGTVDIPLSEVAGFRFPSENDASTTVVMLNGDSITGATELKVLTVETEWGTAQINGQSIQSILFVPNLAWKPSTGLNGKRWTLAEPAATPSGSVPPSLLTPGRRATSPQSLPPGRVVRPQGMRIGN